ncbi:MAG: CDP-alcohol phosphatidyltransferase family protein [Chloroflexi bacterium]|nr:CDP-alcohol phosphatidyltransferase family protein [Chloroflexota bacterium]
MDKVPPQATFLDLSDYARPAALWLVRTLLATPITSIHLTLAFTIVGLAAALLFALDRWLPLAGALLLLKSMLDAADGSLARARQKPSRVGRFLDSVCDFVVMVAVFGGIAAGQQLRTGEIGRFAWLLAALAVLFATLQGSVFSYYYVRYRAQTGGDQTSNVDESASGGYAGDNPTALKILHTLYRLVYSWQDALMDRLDRLVAPKAAQLRPAFLTATTVLGLGSQLLIIAVCAVFGQPVIALWSFVTVFNLYWLALLAVRRFAS